MRLVLCLFKIQLKVVLEYPSFPLSGVIFVLRSELKWCWACLILVHAEYERRWSMHATTVGIAGETYPIWSDKLYVYTLCEHSHESPTLMNSCSK